jgi:hypothetical protein
MKRTLARLTLLGAFAGAGALVAGCNGYSSYGTSVYAEYPVGGYYDNYRYYGGSYAYPRYWGYDTYRYPGRVTVRGDWYRPYYRGYPTKRYRSYSTGYYHRPYTRPYYRAPAPRTYRYYNAPRARVDRYHNAPRVRVYRDHRR